MMTDQEVDALVQSELQNIENCRARFDAIGGGEDSLTDEGLAIRDSMIASLESLAANIQARHLQDPRIAALA